MNKYRITPFLLSIVILILSIIVVGEKNIKTVNTDSATHDEVNEYMKGIWVSYITLDMQNTDMTKESFVKKIEKIINTTKESGFNTLVFQVRPFSDALYKSSYYPWSHILTGTQGKNPNFDPLEIICDMCHKESISVHAWINPYRVSTNETPKKLCDNNPYVKNNSIGFIHNKNVYLDPSSEEAQKLIVNGVIEIVRNYDVDGIQFDDYFYPENSDEVDSEQYQMYKASVSNPLSKEDWRMNNVNLLIKKVYKAIHKYSEKIEFGISPQGNINNNKVLSADVITWCKNEGYIDYICPQIYFSLDNPALTFEESLDDWIKLEKHKKLKLYIGLAGYKGGSSEDEGTWLDNDDILKNEIEISKTQGADGIMLYSYESFESKENEAEIKNVVNYLIGITE
ncbi:MAG: family 10 glycosylhydrolase [Ruminococcus sp.]|nr:family 10 glycosylhydrolase [Ruminococcus sp.]